MHRNLCGPVLWRAVASHASRSRYLGGLRGLLDEAGAAHRHLDGLRLVRALERDLHPVEDLDALRDEGVVVLLAAAVRDVVLAAELVGSGRAFKELDAARYPVGVVVDLYFDGTHGLVGHVREYELLLRASQHIGGRRDHYRRYQ